MSIRPAQVSDLSGMIALDQNHSFPWGAINIERSMSSPRRSLCLIENQQLIGFVVYTLIAGQMDILHIAIARSCQGCGYGRQLLQHLFALDTLGPGTEVFLEVRVSNEPAIRLYQRLGFNEIGIRKNYYRDSNGHEDALQMAMTIA